MNRLQTLGARRPIHRWTTTLIAVAGALPLIVLMNNSGGQTSWLMPAVLAIVTANGWLARSLAPRSAVWTRRGISAWLAVVLVLMIAMASARADGLALYTVATILFVATVLNHVMFALGQRARLRGTALRECRLRLTAVLLAFVSWYLAAAAASSEATPWGNVVQAIALAAIAAFIARQFLVQRPVRAAYAAV